MFQRQVDKRLRFADIPNEFQDYTVDSFDVSLYQFPANLEKAEIVKKLCKNYVEDFDMLKGSGKGLYLYSHTKGSGKTRMAASIANDIIAKYSITVKFSTAIQILDEIKKTWRKNETGEQQFLSDIIHVPVLVIDDIGVEKPSPWVDEKFYSILDGRLTQKQITIFTSNCPTEQLMLDERIISRIAKMAVPVPFPEESIRAALTREENKDFYNKLLGGC